MNLQKSASAGLKQWKKEGGRAASRCWTSFVQGVALVLLVASSTQAVVGNWTAGDHNYYTVADWNTNAIPFTTDQVDIGTAVSNAHITGNINFNGALGNTIYRGVDFNIKGTLTVSNPVGASSLLRF